jgi:hypothetical protein
LYRPLDQVKQRAIFGKTNEANSIGGKRPLKRTSQQNTPYEERHGLAKNSPLSSSFADFCLPRYIPDSHSHYSLITSGFAERIGEPFETLVQTVTSGSASRLDELGGLAVVTLGE